MSAPSQNQFLILTAEQSVPAITAPASQFLSLAPDVSDSYPRAQRPRTTSIVSSSTGSGGNSPTLSATTPAATATTTASQSSSTVNVSNTRVLKLSPVYWGAHAEDCQADYNDIPKSA